MLRNLYKKRHNYENKIKWINSGMKVIKPRKIKEKHKFRFLRQFQFKSADQVLGIIQNILHTQRQLYIMFIYMTNMFSYFINIHTLTTHCHM